MRDNVLSLLSLAYRAGKVKSGSFATKEAVRAGEASLVIGALDASDNTRKKLRDMCNHYGVSLLEYGTAQGIGAAIGKENRVCAAVTDEGFARQLLVKSGADR
ncbi:MAG: ribosomal L7Ae/L30e/S12e/Gadd45 family protein [Eubacterium sp.]|nr:ribosomal L7Ae/L30e/S12e/Gadd45 family protein [Eubacterium sp.]